MSAEVVVRVILSRKGFDSAYGGVPSPILPDGRMISLPIPDDAAPTTYGKVQRDGINLGDLVSDLTKGRIGQSHRVHLDPDIHEGAIFRHPKWKGVFGQEGAAFGHLRNEGVGPGDLFLFYGWFRRAEMTSAGWRYVRGSPMVHAVWGWLIIGSIHSCTALPADIVQWAAGHPHLSGEHMGENAVIIAGQEFRIGQNRYPGSGIFTHHASRTLTHPGSTRSKWRLPRWMHPGEGVATLSYNVNPLSWSYLDTETCVLTSAAIGQEFVLRTERNDLVASWVEGLFAGVDASSSASSD